MTEWWNVSSSSLLRDGGYRGLGNNQILTAVLATDTILWQNSLAVYASTTERRAVFLLDVQQNQTGSRTETEPKIPPTLSTTTQLTLAQYHDYPVGLPSSQLQIAVKTSAKGNPVLKLQRFSQLSGRLTGSSDQLPDWKSQRSVPLVPFQVIGSSHQSAVCIKLREKGDDAASNGVRPSSFYFVVLDLDPTVDTAVNDAMAHPDDEEGAIAPSSLPAIELKCGLLQYDARDVCFGMTPSTETPMQPRVQRICC